MSKSDTTLEQARMKIETVAKELGLLHTDTSGFIKVQGPTNKHRLYVQKSKHLGRIDCTIDLPSDDPAFKQPFPNGSVKCQVVPTLEQLERALRMLGDPNIGTQVPNKPRPFAATKAPPARKPKAVSPTVPLEALEEVPDSAGGPSKVELQNRLKALKARSRLAKIRRIMENPEQYGHLSEEEAAAIVDGKVAQSDMDEAGRNAEAADLRETLAETGIEVAP